MAVDLGKQVGPLPLGAWYAVVAGGLGIALYTYKQQNKAATNTPTVVDDTSGQPGVGDGSVGGWTSTQPSSDTTTSVTYTTNEQWEIAAVNWLIAQGYDPAVADSAMRKYIAGNDPAPSLQERMLQTLAIGHLGAPPQPLPPSPNPDPTVPSTPLTPAPNPPSTPAQPSPAPVTLRYVVVQPWPAKLSTLFGIAQQYYGNGNRWPDIYNVNKNGYRRPDGTIGNISNPNLIKPGWKVWVP